jgi:hypothetical protein
MKRSYHNEIPRIRASETCLRVQARDTTDTSVREDAEETRCSSGPDSFLGNGSETSTAAQQLLAFPWCTHFRHMQMSTTSLNAPAAYAVV